MDVVFEHADGRVQRVRKVAPVQTRRGAEEYERQLRAEMLNPPPLKKKEVPTLEAFAPRFIEGHAKAKRQKASGVNTKESILRVHLLPMFGGLKLDQIHRRARGQARGALARPQPQDDEQRADGAEQAPQGRRSNGRCWTRCPAPSSW